MKALKILLASLLFTAFASAASAQVASVCTGKMYNPVTDTDWNDFFPLTIAGTAYSGGGNTDPALMDAMPPVCVCPTIFGIPFVGVGVTYWQPLYVSEIENRPGCLSSLGGIQVLGGAYNMLASEQTTSDAYHSGETANRMQVHWYEYPVFGMLDLLKSVECHNPSGFNLAYMTELDPLWQDDMWSAMFTPEAALFDNVLATSSCAVDAVASNLHHTLDPMFWCAGSWGNLYPLSGNSSHTGDPFEMNNQIQSKFIARNHRMGLMWQTIGPDAVCSSVPNPIWVKSQYRYDQIGPIVRKGTAVVTGDSGKFLQFPPVTNFPPQGNETINLIWQGQQCCLKAIP